MAHYPVNHHLRQTYRFLAGLAGLYLLLFGVIGLGTTWGDPFFGHGSHWALGLRTNPAAAWLATLAGLVLLAAVVIGGSVHQRVATVLGWALCAYGVLTMAFIQTDANVFDVSMVNVIVFIVLGLICLTAGLYGRTGTDQAARDEEALAHPQ
jgi:peptidoglycan/LPS O-acetylase OafA/YrhL